MSEKRCHLSPPTNSNSQNFSETFDEKSRHDIVKGMDQLHVIIKLPFKRPENLKPIINESWTEEKEKRLFRYLEDTPKDALNWDEASEILNVPKENLYKRIESLSLDNRSTPDKQEINSHIFLKGDQEEGRVSILHDSARAAENQDPPTENFNEIEKLKQQLNILDIEKEPHSSKNPAASKEIADDLNEETNLALEDDAPLSGMSSPFSNISDGSVEHKTSEDYLSQLKHSALSLFK
ncbi:hypothetical protein DSO57_1014333 [Entomophthora muscae]|uniref:Uncharacterized protein n=1 Tax=Entomophthora muscae TaxID=34485 RepID=A0ACC2SIJ4_9FUNG|nr:hypothetical protein DSO57_1014333 [Entomophthora muscae]